MLQEHHVSHVLSSRLLSSRPMGWREQTLKHLVPMLATRNGVQVTKENKREKTSPAVKNAFKAMQRTLEKPRRRPLAVDPESRYRTDIIARGQLNPLYRAIRGLGS
ncbi:MAG: UPF0236 family protein [Lachnospiraceae bacterium]|nr:UPF0236 family protein [Lachnospiraceae bacterium]